MSFKKLDEAGEDEAHLQRGCEPGVNILTLAPAGAKRMSQFESHWEVIIVLSIICLNGAGQQLEEDRGEAVLKVNLPRTLP